MFNGCFESGGVMFIFFLNLFDDGFDMGVRGSRDGGYDIHQKLVLGLFFSAFLKCLDDQFSLMFLLLKVQIVTSSSSKQVRHFY